jgi:catechol 2,3-dioxygenase-like lactoylglutathione lyase family enzyme
MSHVRRFDHVGITVADLDTVTAFFVGLGLEHERPLPSWATYYGDASGTSRQD